MTRKKKEQKNKKNPTLQPARQVADWSLDQVTQVGGPVGKGRDLAAKGPAQAQHGDAAQVAGVALHDSVDKVRGADVDGLHGGRVDGATGQHVGNGRTDARRDVGRCGRLAAGQDLVGR